MYYRKRWVLRESSEKDCRIDYPEISSITAGILKNRGLKDTSELKKFLYPKLSDLYDPYLLPDMEEAVEIIKGNIESHNRIVIYGDYDTDGVTSTSLLYKCFKGLGADIHYYIPRRDDEGYGLNFDAIDEILSKGTNLIITVDCGVSSIREVEYCKKLGGQIIITDHHECGNILPDAPVVNPKRHDSSYPFRELAGVGVAFKLIQGLSKHYGSIDPFKFLEYAAIGTIADIVPLLDENRIIVKHGLEKIRDTNNPGIRALSEVAGIEIKKISSGNISFSIAPRINAIGRIGDANSGVELFTEEDKTKALLIAQKLDEANRIRQGIEEKIFKDAEEKVKTICTPRNDLIFVLESGEWNVGVVGIAASKIVEKYYRSAVLLCREGNICRGSARSIPGINIYEALESCKDLLIKYGGHGLAAGLTIPVENVDEFNARINEYAKARLSGISLTPLVNFDMEIFPKNVSLGLADELKMLEPFGAGNPSPSFACRNLLVQEIRTVGASDKHLKMKLSGLSETFDAIAFNMGYNIDGYSKGDNVDVICELDKNVWNGREDIQLIVRDIRTPIQKSLENNYYRSFKYFIENIMLDIPFKPHVIGEFGLYEKPIENIIDDTLSSPGKLILMGNINSLYIFSGYENQYEICFETNISALRNKPVIVLNPNMDKIIIEGINTIYVFDNLIDYNSISKVKVSDMGINCVICSLSADNDIEYINTLKPSIIDINCTYEYLEASMVNGIYNCTIDTLSQRLSFNKFKTYYSLRILHEMRMISVDMMGSSGLSIRLSSSFDSNRIENSIVLKKFDAIIDMLNKINIYFQKIKGEYK